MAKLYLYCSIFSINYSRQSFFIAERSQSCQMHLRRIRNSSYGIVKENEQGVLMNE